MEPVAVVVKAKLLDPPFDGSPTAHPRRMKAVGVNFERVKPFFDEASRRIIEPTAQSETGEGSRVAITIDEKFDF